MKFDAVKTSLKIALKAFTSNTLRSILTTTGVLFGVASVITILAIGNGAKKTVEEQLNQLGANNFFIQQKDLSNNDFSENKKKQNKYSPGLQLQDSILLNNLNKYIESWSPIFSSNADMIANNTVMSGKVYGVNSIFFKLSNIIPIDGQNFTPAHNTMLKSVCVISLPIAQKLFQGKNPLNQNIQVNGMNFQIIGIIQSHQKVNSASLGFEVINYNESVFIPSQVYNIRIENTSILEPEMVEKSDNNNSKKDIKINHKKTLGQFVIKAKDKSHITSMKEILHNGLLRLHNGVEDFQIIIPEIMLKQSQETNDLFTLLLALIAAISLLVGGIGIMNIMLASVSERIKEIGIRMALGARQSDILLQFISEAVIISGIGGIAGIVVGVFLSHLVEWTLKMPVCISLFSILLSFGISVSIGCLFGYLPAKNASFKDPISSLRHD